MVRRVDSVVHRPVMMNLDESNPTMKNWEELRRPMMSRANSSVMMVNRDESMENQPIIAVIDDHRRKPRASVEFLTGGGRRLSELTRSKESGISTIYGWTYGAKAIVCSVESMVSQPVMRKLGASKAQTEMLAGKSNANVFLKSTSSRSLFPGDYDAVDMHKTKLQFLRQDYEFISKESSEIKNHFLEMEDQLKSIMTLIEQRQMQAPSDDLQLSPLPKSSNIHSQVSDFTLEQNLGEYSLGYRSDALNVKNHDSMLQSSETPMFDGNNLDDWIEKVEIFFSFMMCGEETKLDLVSFCLEGEALKWFRQMIHKRKFKDWADLKQELLNRFAQARSCSSVKENNSSTMEAIKKTSGDEKFVMQPCSVKEFVGLDSTGIAVEESVEMPQLTVHEKESIEKETIPVSELVKKGYEVSLDFHKEVVLTQEYVPAIAHEADLLQLVESQKVETVFVQSSDYTIHNSSSWDIRFSNESLFAAGQEAEMECTEAMLVKLLKSVNVDGCVRISHCGSDTLHPANIEETYDHLSYKSEEDVKISHNKTVITKSFCAHQNVLICDHMLQRVSSKKKKMKWLKTWKFKFKEEHYKHSDRANIKWTVNLHMRWLRLSTMRNLSFKAAMAEMMFLLVQYGSFKASTAQNLPASKANCRIQRLCSMGQILLEFQQFTVGVGNFTVNHIWRFKQLTQASLLALELAAGRKSELQPSEFYHGSYLIIFISTSLWASLFSRGRVYMRILSYWFRLDVLIWLYLTSRETDILKKDVRKQWRKEELVAHGLLQVMIHLVLKGRRVILLMCIKRHLLHMLIHYKQIWTKCYKSRMFKYKQRSSKTCIWTWIDMPQLVVIGAFVCVTSGEAVNLQGCDYGDGWLAHRWSAHRGNKLMHHLLKRKSPKLWRFKDKIRNIDGVNNSRCNWWFFLLTLQHCC